MPFIKKSLMNKKKIIRVTTVPESIRFYYDLIPTLQKEYEVVGVSSPGEELNALSEKGVRTIEVAMERRISIISDIKSLWEMYKVLRNESPDIVHSITPKAGLITMIAAWLCRVPVRIHTFTGLVWPTAKGLKRRILMFTDWLTCTCATHVIPEGEGVKTDLQCHITRKPMKVLGYGNVKGVDMERFSLRPEIVDAAKGLRSRNLFTFLYVGRIVSDKGVNELVDAFGKLHALNPHCRLVLVGKMEENLDPLKPSTLKKILAQKGIQAVGEKRDDELIAWYAASDCFVLPSYREGFPNTVLEAGAMGLPSIVTDINGSREIVENGKNGIIIPPKDENALIEAMQQMLDNDSKRDSMSTAARPMIASRFEKSYVQQCLLDFYHEIL